MLHMRGRELSRYILPLVAAATGACATIHRPPATRASLQADQPRARATERATTDTVIERLVRRAERRGDNTLDVLLLSGGGQLGAFGAGFLRGWRSRADAAMPTFDLVSGISTGSLQAPFALVGTQAMLDTLARLYREATERTAPSFDWLFWLRKTGGVVKPARLERTIAHVLDSAMANGLRAQFALDRQLLIGTADMDLGMRTTWDFTRVLAEPDGLTHARRLMRATSAIPGVFPPVILDGHVHADGGVISNVMPMLEYADYARLSERLRARGVASPVTVRLWVVMNLFLDVPVQVMKPSSRGAMSSRSTAVIFLSQQARVLERLGVLARAVSNDIPGVELELRATALDAELANEPAAAKLVDKAFMLRIEQLGYERARGDRPWDLVVSRDSRQNERTRKLR